jgi:hypothetical protein
MSAFQTRGRAFKTARILGLWRWVCAATLLMGGCPNAAPVGPTSNPQNGGNTLGGISIWDGTPDYVPPPNADVDDGIVTGADVGPPPDPADRAPAPGDLQFVVRVGGTVELEFNHPDPGTGSVQFILLSMPARGALSPIDHSDPLCARATYKAPENFVGVTAFEFATVRDGVTSSVAIGRIAVYPDIRFSATPDFSTAEVAIRAQAYIADDQPWPSGRIRWIVDDQQFEGPMSTFRERRFPIGPPRAHELRMLFTLGAMTLLIPGTTDGANDVLDFEISPTVSGAVTDANGAPLPLARVQALGDAPENDRFAKSDANGEYRIELPWDFSGEVSVDDLGSAYSPAAVALSRVRTNIVDANFRATGEALPPPGAESRSFDVVSGQSWPLTLGPTHGGGHLDIEVLALPLHGQLMTIDGSVFGTAPFRLPAGTDLFYKSNPFYVGNDQLSYRYVTPAGTGTNGRVSINVLSDVLPEPVAPPTFAIYAGNTFRRLRATGQPVNGVWTVTTPEADVELRKVGQYEWELRVSARAPVGDVWFPWPEDDFSKALRQGGQPYYFTMLHFGAVSRVADTPDFAWAGPEYPGAVHSPWVICATNTHARIVAASNWPPRKVNAMHCGTGMAIRYTQPLPAGQIRTYRAILRTVAKPAGDLQPAWAPLIDTYRDWLQARMQAENLNPDSLPEELKLCHGWFAFQLQNMHAFNADFVRNTWRHWRSRLPWIQFWGQMSNYAGPVELAVPRPAPGEDVGCCLERPSFHNRYLPGLPNLVQDIRADGGYIGFYTRPGLEANLDNPNERQALRNWVQQTLSSGANALYVDVIGNGNFGDLLSVAKFLRDETPPATVIEFGVDIYPRPNLMSGSLRSGSLEGGPNALTELAAGQRNSAPFVEIGRFFMNDRTIFMGQLNGDGRFWGSQNNHWGERQAFLLGCKLDVSDGAADSRSPLGAMNPMVVAIIDERDRVQFWQRRPVYRHREGLQQIPTGIDARVFRCQDGRELIACDNPQQRTGQQLRFRGRLLNVPATRISLIEATP